MGLKEAAGGTEAFWEEFATSWKRDRSEPQENPSSAGGDQEEGGTDKRLGRSQVKSSFGPTGRSADTLESTTTPGKAEGSGK